jgi:GNAT superfamily N-acetyltransferase
LTPWDEEDEVMSRNIRPAGPQDCAAILAAIRGLAEYEKLAHEVIADEAALRATLFGASPAAEVLLVEDEGEVAGFALFFTSYSTFLARAGLYLEDLFVHPPFRGRGHGLALMRRLARICVEREYGRFEWSVLDWNEPAIDFYRRLGARPMEGWTVNRIDGEALRALAEEVD